MVILLVPQGLSLIAIATGTFPDCNAKTLQARAESSSLLECYAECRFVLYKDTTFRSGISESFRIFPNLSESFRIFPNNGK
jgi:hypothetical protein